MSGMIVFCFGGKACASFKTSLSCFCTVHFPDDGMFSYFRHINILVMMWPVCLLEVFLVIALHCPNIRSSSSVLRRRGDMMQFSKGA